MQVHRGRTRVSARQLFRSDRGLAATVGVLAFIVYLRTLLPDVGGPEDTAKFQYLGAALGTAHPPGYPLHTLLSHLFSYLPIGTIAYRANLLSAVAGATAVSLAVLLARALGLSRPAAAFAALTTAFGAAFWGYAVLAEVYTLSAALLLAIIFWLVRWKQTRRDAHLYGAAACFALALGNHLVIVATAPAIAMFLLATDARRALRPRTLITAGAIVCSGFLQYLYVLIRTRQGTPYREASATNLTELVAVIRGRGYEDYVFPFSWNEVIGERVPEFFRLVQAEIGVAGIALAIVGFVLLVVRDWRAASLLALAFAGVAGFDLNIYGDLRGFLVIPLILAAPLMAAGGDGVREMLTRALGVRGAAIAAVLLLLYPAWQLGANFAANDWRPRTHEARFFRAMFEQLPSRVAVVPEDYVADSIVTYLLVESGAARTLLHVDPHAAAVRTAFDAGEPVFALNKRYEELAARGFHFVPVRLWMDDVDVGDWPRRHAYRLVQKLETIPFGDAAWTDLTAVAGNGKLTVLVDNYRPHDTAVKFYAVADEPLQPQLIEGHRFGTGQATIQVQHFDRQDVLSRLALDKVLAAEGAAASSLGAAGRYIARIEHHVNDEGQFSAWGLSLGGVPLRVIGQAQPDRPALSRALAGAMPGQ